MSIACVCVCVRVCACVCAWVCVCAYMDMYAFYNMNEPTCTACMYNYAVYMTTIRVIMWCHIMWCHIMHSCVFPAAHSTLP